MINFILQELNEEYQTNLKKLDNFVMVKFLKDSMVVPRESEWFGFYAPGQDVEVLPLQQTQLYLEVRVVFKTISISALYVLFLKLYNWSNSESIRKLRYVK